MRSTGRLHIGHYFGALQNWIQLQNDPQQQYQCFFFIADWHALTTNYADTSAVAKDTVEMAIDWLASGLDPQKCTIFLQSSVPEHAELHLLLSMVTPLGWLERVPTYKEALDNIRDKDLHTYGFLGYPVLQSADIVMYGEPDGELWVPVGEDQVSHVELTREIVQRFYFYYGYKISPELHNPACRGDRSELAKALGVPSADPVDYDPEVLRSIAKAQGIHDAVPKDLQTIVFDAVVKHKIREMGIDNALIKLGSLRKYLLVKRSLVEPQAMLTRTPRIPGLDGRKMSKSYGNAITLSESDENIRNKTRVMMTDPARKRRTDKGNPDLCPVFDWHKLFSPPETQAWSAHGCRTAEIGCIECKAAMAGNLIQWIAPIRERRQEYEQQPQRVLEIVDAGSKQAQSAAQQTMARVREAIFDWSGKREEIGRAAPEAKTEAKDAPAGH